MANRRKFLAGLGALASGSAAAVGTGAFTSVSANRVVSVDVSDDQNAYLQLRPSKYADFTTTDGNGVLEMDFSGVNGQTGDGVNANATTGFGPELTIRNNGTAPARVVIDKSGVDDALSGDGSLGFYAPFKSDPYNRYDGVKSGATFTTTSPNSAGNVGVVLGVGSFVSVAGNLNIDGWESSVSDASITVYGITDDSERFPNGGPNATTADDGGPGNGGLRIGVESDDPTSIG
ncbi:hypothetical protein B9H04_17020 [Halorubrum ezzemoulense DSM 17463]|uniref:DUF1102 domain-containing protein n=1 Tax=Halorubrum ezzemoulense DSM 17463 TaxID=1121945 RepID=A0A1X4G6E7_HALEZ|nr:hypothetical protein [Halorubrum ezzemoulense]OSO90463.1 hypothetical protein B9H04_17020 [Halorubrum ezzemoulense DSM 17463]